MKKIMFNDRYGLTEAVLTGRKTMTRRIVKQKEIDEFATNDTTRDFVAQHYAAYKVGEEIAVAQSYRTLIEQGYFQNEHGLVPAELCKGDAYRNKMFVRADLMPHRIRITDIKVELLQDISDEDCLREGVEKWLDSYIATGIMERDGKNNATFATPREAFTALIDRVSGRGTWERNPYVFAYTFELVK